MNPRLIVLSGLPEKETVNLNLENGESFTLGRGTECSLPLGNAAVSRNHCRITRIEDDFELEDLDSHNGTFVNKMPVETRLLEHGDHINIGNAYILFLLTEEDYVFSDDDSLVMKSTVRLFPFLNAQPDGDEFSPDLDALVKFGKALKEIKDARALQHRFLEIILELIPARRGAIILTKEDINESKSACVLSSGGADIEPIQISRTVCQCVLFEEAALMSNDLSEPGLSSSESLIASQVRSLLCVPLKIGGNKGLIYLDSNSPEFRFTENQLQQMTALSFLISAALANAEFIENLSRENETLKADLKIETKMLGESAALQEINRLIAKVAPNDSTVLISGESGTGKELAAKAIHENSLRAGRPFEAINCAVLSETLVESELFGHEKGAFTDAFTQKKGKLELADGGTIFLDEIAELTPLIQAKLLRVIQEREFKRIGGAKIIKVDVRFIGATNRSLEEEVKKGKFREDLFFRLNVLQINMPPLRERRSDIPLLARHFVKKHSERCNRKVSGLSPQAQQMLVDYDWRGNVRELENVIERAIVLGSTEQLLPGDLPLQITGNGLPAQEIFREEAGAGESFEAEEILNLNEQMKIAKKKILLDALIRTGGNYTKAARGLGVDPTNLHRMARNLEIK
ncbi:MAG: sigma 54-interacting transcriptional regulator [Pyrinomonadaceae bacterium]